MNPKKHILLAIVTTLLLVAFVSALTSCSFPKEICVKGDYATLVDIKKVYRFAMPDEFQLTWETDDGHEITEFVKVIDYRKGQRIKVLR